MNRIVPILALAVVFALTSAAPALALAPPTVPMPEPTTLSLLSGGVALAIIGARWFRRK